MDWQPLALLPPADGRDVAPQIGGNLLPRFQTPPMSIRSGVGWECHLDRHVPVGSCLGKEVLHRFLSVATAWSGKKSAECHTLPFFTSLCTLREAYARHRILLQAIKSRCDRSVLMLRHQIWRSLSDYQERILCARLEFQRNLTWAFFCYSAGKALARLFGAQCCC